MKKFYIFLLLFAAAGTILFLHARKFGEVKGVKIVSEYPPDTMVVTFLDIGQGDATYIRFPDGTDMLIDCSKDARILEALGRVMSAFDRTIDYLVPTHPDLDHYGGCIDVLHRFDVKHVVYSGYEKDDGNNQRYQSFMSAVQNEQAEYHHILKPDTWTIASTTIEFIYPDHDVSHDPEIPDSVADVRKEESNNTSIIMKITYGGSSVLFTGDMGIHLENYLTEKYKEKLDVDIIKVGHHGSSGSSGEEFLAAVSPEHAVISAGKDNSYGHPTLRVLRRLERTGAQIWRTDEAGDIRMIMGSEGIKTP